MSTWKNRVMALVAATALVIVPSVPALAAGEVNQPSESQQILTLMNQARVNAGLQPLTGWSALDPYAVAWSTQMSTSGVFDHVTDPTMLANSTSAGCSGQVGENIAWTTVTSGKAQSIFDSYMGSQLHRDAILNATYKYVGVGTVTNSAGRTYNTIRFSANCATTTLPTPVINVVNGAVSGTGNDRVYTITGGVTNAGNATSVPITVRVTSSVTGLVSTYAATATGSPGNLSFNAVIPKPTQSTVQFLIGADPNYTAANATTTINAVDVNQWSVTPLVSTVDIEAPGRVALFDVSVAPVAGQPIMLQKLVGGVWQTVDTRPTTASDYFVNVQLTDEVPQTPQSITYRVVNGGNISAESTVAYQWGSAILPTVVTGWPTEATTIERYLDGAMPSFALEVTPARGRNLQVQQLVGGTWQQIGSYVTSNTNTWSVNVALPNSSLVGNREFRLYSPATQWTEAYTSSVVTVKTNKFPLTIDGWPALASVVNVYPDNTSGTVTLPLTITGGYDRPLYLSRDGGPGIATPVVEGENAVNVFFSKTQRTTYTAWMGETAQYAGWNGAYFYIDFVKYATVLNGWGDAREVDIYEGEETTLDLSGWHFKTDAPETVVGDAPVAVIQYRVPGSDSWNDAEVVALSSDAQSVTLPTPALNTSYEYRAVINGTEDYDGFTSATLTVNKVLAPVEVTGWEGGSITHTVETPLVRDITVDSPRDVLVYLQSWDAVSETWIDEQFFFGSEFTVEIPTNNLGVTTYRLDVRDDYSETFSSELLEVDVIRSVASVDWDSTSAYLESGDILDLSFTVLPLDNRPVTLESSVDGGDSWQTVETFNASGTLTHSFEPSATATLLRVVAPETAWVSAIESPAREVFVDVTPVSLTGAPSGLNYIAATDDFSFNVSASLTDETRTLELQKFESGEWVAVDSASLGADKSFTVEPGDKGTISQYRLFVADVSALKPGVTSEVFSVISEAVPVSVNGWVSEHSSLVGTVNTPVLVDLTVAPHVAGETEMTLVVEQYNESGELVSTQERSSSDANWSFEDTLDGLMLGDAEVGQIVLKVRVGATSINDAYTTPSLSYTVVDGSTTIAGWPTETLRDVSLLDTVAFDIAITPNLQGRTIELQETVDGETWTTVNTVPYMTGASAVRVQLPGVPVDVLAGGAHSQTKFYRLNVPAAGIYEAATTEQFAIEYVRATGVLTVASDPDGYVVEKDSELLVSAATTPLPSDVLLQRNTPDGWENVKTVALGATPTAVSIPTETITGTGVQEYRFVRDHSDSVTGTTSAIFTVKVVDNEQAVLNWVTGNVQVTPGTTEYVMNLRLTPVLDNTRLAFLEKSVDGVTWEVVEELNLATTTEVVLPAPAPNTVEHWRVRVEAQDYLSELITGTFTLESVKYSTSITGAWNDAETLKRYVGETVSFEDVVLESEETRPVVLQERIDGEWVDVEEFTGTLPVITTPGTHVYRLSVAETPSATGYVSGELTVISDLRPVTLTGWSTGSISTFIGQDVVLPVEASTGQSVNIFRIALASVSEPLDVSLQVEAADGSWTTVDTYEDVTGVFDVTIPAQTLGSFSYRLFVPATATSAEFTSEVLDVEVTRFATTITAVEPTNRVLIGSDFDLSFTVNPTDLVRTATLQEFVEGAWVDVESTETAGGVAGFNFDTLTLGSRNYRVVVAETETYEGVASRQFSVDVVKFSTVVTGWETKIDVPFGTTVAPVLNFTIENLDKRPVYIERLVDGEWVRSGALTYAGMDSEASDRTFSFTLPLLLNVTEDTRLSYRLVVEESETVSGYTSEMLVVNYLAKDVVTPTPTDNTGTGTPTGTATPTNTGTSTPTKTSTKTPSASPSATKGVERLEDTGSEGMLTLIGLSALTLLGGAGVLAYRKRIAER